MTDFEKLLTQVQIFEGYRANRYLDVAGVPTVGYGFTANVFADGQVPTYMDKQTATNKLELILKEKLEYVRYKLKYWGYTTEVIECLQYPLTDFTYNCGSGNLSKLTQNGLRDIETIKKKLLEYNKAGGKVYAGLTTRRQWEYDYIVEKQKEIKTTNQQAIQKDATAFDIQKLLNDKFGYSLQCDGIIGKLTRNAIYDTLKNNF